MNSFEQIWPQIEPTIERLLADEPIDRQQWQELFGNMNLICSWDSKGPQKILKSLRSRFGSILDERVKPKLISMSQLDDQQFLLEYSRSWRHFHDQHCTQFQRAFQQLDLATEDYKIVATIGPIDDVIEEYSCSATNATTRQQVNTGIRLNSLADPRVARNCDSRVRSLLLKLWNDVIVSEIHAHLKRSALSLISQERKGKSIEGQLIDDIRESYQQLDSLKISNYRSNYLASFIEVYLVASGRRLMEAVPLVSFLSNKQSFVKYHRILLSRRFILNTANDLEQQAQFVDQIRALNLPDMPYDELNRLNRMFKDLKFSEEFYTDYLKSQEFLKERIKLLQQEEEQKRVKSLDESKITTTTTMNNNNNDDFNYNNNNINHNHNIKPEIGTTNTGNNNPKADPELLNHMLTYVDSRLSKLGDGKSRVILDEMTAKLESIRIINPSCWPGLASFESNAPRSSSSSSSSSCSPGSIVKLPSQVKVPAEEIRILQDDIEAFYKIQFNDRRLTWSSRLSNGSIRFNSTRGQYDLRVTGSQYLLLAILDQDGTKSFDELRADSGMDLVEFKRTLWSLVSNPKLKVQLISCGQLKALADFKDLDKASNRFSVNGDFALMKQGKAQSRGQISLIGRLHNC